MEENEKNKMIKCPHCQKDVTHIEGSLRCTYDNERKVFFSAVNLVCRYDRT